MVAKRHLRTQTHNHTTTHAKKAQFLQLFLAGKGTAFWFKVQLYCHCTVQDFRGSVLVLNASNNIDRLT